MNKQRRKLLKAGVLAGMAAMSGTATLPAAADANASKSDNALHVLILGGTGFIGPHMVRELLRRGHRVTLFNRGRTNAALFPDLTTLIGDRNRGLDALRGHTFDAVIDNSGYVPRHVADSAGLLAKAARHYVFVSSISAYASLAKPLDETAPLASLADESVEEVTADTYGPLKALCEKRAGAAFGAQRLTILRPTFVCGPGDHTDRFTYWPVRTNRGGDMVWPGAPGDAIQIIDARDLANFTADVVERHQTGVFNTVTSVGALTMGSLLDDCRALTRADVNPVWIDQTFLRGSSVSPESFPIWVPSDGTFAGAAHVSGKRAAAAGLRNRPLRETVRDTLSWWQDLTQERRDALRAGPSADDETALLAAWRD